MAWPGAYGMWHGTRRGRCGVAAQRRRSSPIGRKTNSTLATGNGAHLRRIDSLPSTPRTNVSGAASIGTCESQPMLTGFSSVLPSAFSTVARDGCGVRVGGCNVGDSARWRPRRDGGGPNTHALEGWRGRGAWRMTHTRTRLPLGADEWTKAPAEATWRVGGREVRRGSDRGRGAPVSTYQEREREALHHDEQLGGREEGGEGWLQGQGVQDQVKEINQGGAEGSSSTETGRGCTRASAAGGGGGGSGGRVLVRPAWRYRARRRRSCSRLSRGSHLKPNREKASR